MRMLTSRNDFLSATAVIVFAALLVSGCGGKSDRGSQTAATTEKDQIALLEAAQSDGPWTRRLSLRLGRAGVPTQFYVCAVRDGAGPCAAREGATLPAGSTLRLEQQPVGPGLERPDSPGWGLVGTSEDPVLKLTLSDFVSVNNKPGHVTYRVTLRDPSGHVTATSNTTTISWHR